MAQRDPTAFMSKPIREFMELIEELERDDMDHWWRYLLKCRECGQMYFFEFFETIDWNHGNDPQLKLMVPVESRSEIEPLLRRAPGSPITGTRYLREFWPADGEKIIGWVG